MSRSDLGRMARLITGHNVLNYHMSVMTRDHEDRCRFCDQERETFFHFVTQCPRLLTYRADLFQHCEGMDCLEWEPEKVLSRVF